VDTFTRPAFAQGCQMAAFFQTKNPNLGKFSRDLQWKWLVYFMAIGPFYDHLVYFAAIWYILWLFGIFFHVLVFCPKKNLATVPSLTTTTDLSKWQTEAVRH
jgi:hypothetical protein